MKRKTLLLLALIASIGTAWAADKTIWLNPAGFNDKGNWTNDGAVFFAYASNNDDSKTAWIRMSDTRTINGATCYKGVISDEYTDFKLVRINPANAEHPSFANDVRWNETAAIYMETDNVNNNDLFTITGWSNYEKSVGLYTYTVTFKNSVGWSTVKAYVTGGTGNPDTDISTWSGKSMNKVGDVYTVTFESSGTPATIIFNNGSSGDYNQTADLTFENNKVYNVGYYVVGDMNSWTVGEDYVLTKIDGVFVSNFLSISSGQGLKIAYSRDGKTRFEDYPSYGGNYTMSETGNYKVYFRAMKDGDGTWFEKYIKALKQGTYTANFTNSVGWNKVYAYTYNPETLGAYPGTLMNKTGIYDARTITTDVNAPKIIFNNGDYPGVEGVSKTENLDFTSGTTYDLDAIIPTTSVVGNVATVTGTVSGSNASAIQTAAGSAAVIDLSGAYFSGGITLNPTNVNAVVVVNGTERTPDENAAAVLTTSGKNIVVKDGTTYSAKDGVDVFITDANTSQPAYDFVINAQQDGFAYQRTIGADKWVSYNSPAPVTIPDGVDVYQATDATTSSVTFTKQDNKNIGANAPVILHNTTGSEVVITSINLKADLNLTANPGGSAVNGTAVMQYGTARAISTDGSQFALSNGNLHPFKGATIGAFRVYYTGLTGNTGKANAIFVDNDEVSHIGSIDADGAVTGVGEVYNLAGQRVGKDYKGIVIVNGKKYLRK